MQNKTNKTKEDKQTKQTIIIINNNKAHIYIYILKTTNKQINKSGQTNKQSKTNKHNKTKQT